MAEAPLSPEKVRILTASKDLSPQEADRQGDALFAAGRVAEAMMFYERSKTQDRLEKVKKHAIQNGDAFFLNLVAKLAPESVTPEEWRETGERALRSEKFIFARDGFERSGDTDRAREAHDKYLSIFGTKP